MCTLGSIQLPPLGEVAIESGGRVFWWKPYEQSDFALCQGCLLMPQSGAQSMTCQWGLQKTEDPART